MGQVWRSIGAMKKGTRGGVQNWENKEQNGGKRLQNGAFLGVVINENTCWQTKLKS